MISSETTIDVLAEISKNLDRIASALESLANCACRNDGQREYIEIFATTHES